MLPPKVKDISGQRFGKLTACEFVGLVKHRAMWSCHCDCGRESVHAATYMLNGNTTSCGCVKATIGKTSNLKHGASSGGAVTRTYGIFRSMIQRCEDANCKSFADYGARGISVCKEWRNDYARFLSDMGECPEGYSIERVNTNGNYELSNCKWIPKSEQNRNTRSTVRYIVDDVEMIQADLARHLGMNPSSVSQMRREGRLPNNVRLVTA